MTMCLEIHTVSIISIILCIFCADLTSAEDQKRILIQDNYYEIMSKLDNHTKELEVLKKETSLLIHQPVAFVAYLTSPIMGELVKNRQIVFDNVTLNIGNGYHNAHGNFIVPINGTYQFTITACSDPLHYIVLELTVNTVVVDKVLAGDDHFVNCNTGVFIQRLSVGDDVYVQHKAQGDILSSHLRFGRPMFTGLLLFTI